MTNDEDLALALHRQLNATSLRKRRGQDPAAQQSLELIKRVKQGRSRGRRERTTSTSQDHPSSRKKRDSDPDDEYGHTSAQRGLKREPTESNQSHPGYHDQHHAPNSRIKAGQQVKQCDSRDSGMHPAEQQLDVQGGKHSYSPGQAAAILAAQTTKQRVRLPADEDGPACVKVFYAGVRWSLSLQPAAVKTRQLLAKALNDAFVGDILSVGQGECLSAVFLDVSGTTAEVGPTKWGSSKVNASQWETLARTATRIYVKGPECFYSTP